MKDANSFTDDELEMMAHGNNPQSNAYRELLAFRKSDGWIKCSEKMPEVEEEYYLAYSGGITDIAYFFDGRFVDPYITHWQSLPAPPTTEK